MSIFRKKRLLVATTIYWFLLVYIVAGIVWWFIALEQQNRQVTSYKLEQIRQSDPSSEALSNTILSEQKRKTAQYIGEGLTFIILFMTGAIMVYVPVRRQIKLQQQQQNFMMAVTHELKTPIAVAKLNLETLLKHHLDEQRQRKMMESALSETNRLNILTNNILVSAQLEAGRYQKTMERLDLSGLVRKAAEEFRARFPDRKLEIDVQHDAQITGDEFLIRILTNNLLENAIKYSGNDQPVRIMLSMREQRPVLQVVDRGPGIPAAERRNIFEMFYRIGNEQTRTARGTGLGLYLCKKIAKDHGARIEVSDNQPVGSIFTVLF
jgi:K+-sensing histidine kinase KdpD